MLRIAICDDNKIQLDIVRELLSNYSKSTKTSFKYVTFQNAGRLLKHVNTNEPFDIYILDIIMPGMNGMELAKALRDTDDKGQIIFLTSDPNYAEDSYDVNAFYYLLKPVDTEKFNTVLSKAITLAENNKAESDNKKIKIKIV